MFDLVVIGVGKMGAALVSGFSKAGAGERIGVVDHNQEKIESLVSQLSGVVAAESSSVARTYLLAVKPYHVKSVLAELPRDVSRIISIAAGISLSQLAQWAPPHAQIVRAMPNTPSEIGEGVTAVCSSGVEEGFLEEVEGLFLRVGEVVRTEERLFDVIASISGSGPAYMFLLIESLQEAGVRMGLHQDLARRLAVQTMVGSGLLARSTGRDPRELRLAVTSPGGMTAAALEAFERNGFRTAVYEATQAAVEAADHIARRAEPS
ncbi:MAG: pyrroline-5-carboxylate reductase [Ferrimicrobium sp.]